jgi:hypothetical protein
VGDAVDGDGLGVGDAVDGDGLEADGPAGVGERLVCRCACDGLGVGVALGTDPWVAAGASGPAATVGGRTSR